MCRYAIKNSLKPSGKNKDKISMAYVDYCLIVNSYGKNLGKENPWQSLENNKYDLRIIIVIICLWYLLKNPCGENRRYDIGYVFNIPNKNPCGENKRYDIWTCIDIASLKTFYEKPMWGKTHRGKECNIMFWTGYSQCYMDTGASISVWLGCGCPSNTGYSFKRSLPLNLANLKVIAYQSQQHIVICGNW